MTLHELTSIIKSCKKGKRESQKALYQHFYNYGMTICMRYTRNREEAREVLNDAFVKAYKYNGWKTGMMTWQFKSDLNSAKID